VADHNSRANAVPAPRSRASHEARSGLHPAGFDRLSQEVAHFDAAWIALARDHAAYRARLNAAAERFGK
jgi:hypothetical protein